MKYENKEGQGSLFRNEKQSDRQPDYRGTIVIGGATYEIAGWVKTSKKGLPYLNIKAVAPRNAPQNGLFNNWQDNGMPF